MTAVKGWCPGALRPMESGDGLIIRVRPRLARLDAAQLLAIADGAARFGNGEIDLTRRANIQLRGVTTLSLSDLQAHLDRTGLLDDTVDDEARRNILASPLLGVDPKCADLAPVGRQIEDLLREGTDLRDLPTKFGWSLDGGGTLPLQDRSADIRLVADGEEVALFAAHQYLGHCSTHFVASVAVILARTFLELQQQDERRMGTLLERTGTQAITQILEPHLRRGSVPNRPASAEHIGHRADQRWLGIGFPFGAATASELRFVADLARAPGRDVRVTPWRALIVTNMDKRDAEAALKRAAGLHLIVRADDPRRSLVACSGAPACPSAEAETRPLALTLARQLPAITSGSVLHISGCAKGCAQREPADVVVTACQGRYRLKFDAAPTDAGGPLLTAAEVLQHLEAQHSTGAS